MDSKRRFVLDRNAVVHLPAGCTAPVRHALRMLVRDMTKVFGAEPRTTEDPESAGIRIQYADRGDPLRSRPECYALRFSSGGTGGGPVLTVVAPDDLGLVYGLLRIGSEYLGVDPFWFWADREPERRASVEIPANDIESPEPRIKLRGWFVNDEVCLIGWTDEYPPPEKVWYPVFEALLRCGGNMVIPGTDLPRGGIQSELAAEMGLRVTHHHAEPLGAEMFFRAYPSEEASYDRNARLFEGLWAGGIRRQKGRPIVWTVGFRGQGDCPFWEQDPSCDTDEKRGNLVGRVIARQVEMVRREVRDPCFAAYLYGELTELYRRGLISLPPDVIRVWADNGYGRMVSRRQGNLNPRIPALPESGDPGRHGVYYHVTFHDLQASNHLTMFPSGPGLAGEELEKAFRAGADEYLLVNCGNIRPHIFMLGFVSRLWNAGTADADAHFKEFSAAYFPSAPEAAASCYRAFFGNTIRYGPNEDDRAGDEFYHHPARSLIGHWIRGETDGPAADLAWAAGNLPFRGQVRVLLDKLNLARKGWSGLGSACLSAAAGMAGRDKDFFMDNLQTQVVLHDSGCRGFISLCGSFFKFMEKSYPEAFVLASRAIREYTEGLEALRRAERGKWKNFYRADWLTNIRSTLYSLEAVRKLIRMHGDSPDFFLWYKKYLMPESEKKIYLENTHRKPLSDDELAERLEKKLFENG